MTLTPEQFNKLATKEDLKDFEKRMEENFASKDDINRIINALDELVGKHKNHDEDHAFNQAAHDRYEERITKIEDTLGIEPTLA